MHRSFSPFLHDGISIHIGDGDIFEMARNGRKFFVEVTREEMFQKGLGV